MRITLLVVLTLALFSCKNSTNTNSESASSKDANVANSKIDNDSIQIVGKQILNGQRIWGRNEDYLFSLMDSLTSKKADSRFFYFKVFGVICEQADGYVAEAIGLYVLKYFELNPGEFIRNSSFISDTTFKSMGYEAGLEISMSNDKGSQDTLEKLINKTNEKLKNEPDSIKIKLKTFFTQMKEGLNSND